MTRGTAILALVVMLAAAGEAQRGGTQSAGKKAVVAEDPREVLQLGLTLARSAQAGDHRRLEGFLNSTDFLGRLDTPQEYRETGRRLRISRLLEALAKNSAPSAANVLVNLTNSGEFLREPRRVDYLILHTADVRPAPPQLVAFWDHYSQPDDGFTHLTIHTLTANGSEPALALLERKLADPGHSDEDKRFWMRYDMLPHRNEVPLLLSVERLLGGVLPERLRGDLVDAIFDYKPDQWYSEADPAKAPDRHAASPEARQILRRIARQAVATVQLSPEQQAAIKKAMVEIGPE